MKRHFLLSILSLLSILALCVGCSTGGQGFDWPAWRGPEGNGISKETGWNPRALSGEPRILWKVDVGKGHANASIRGSLLVSMGTAQGFTSVYGLKANTGKKIWRYSYEGSDDTQATPVIAGDSVYALDSTGLLMCLKASNGKLRWQTNLVRDCGAMRPFYGFAGSPVIAGDLVILTANSAGIALNKNSGAVIWVSDPPPKQFEASDHRDTNGADYATPVVFKRQGKSYALIASWKGLSAVAVETGQPLWVYEWEMYTGRQVTDALVLGDSIFITENSTMPNVKSSVGSLLLEVRGETPVVMWKSLELQTEISNAVALGGCIYGGQGGPYLYGASLRCLDMSTGRLRWEKTMSDKESPACVTLTAADGKLIVLTDDGILAVAEAAAEAYREISRCSLASEVEVMSRFWTAPVLCNGRIYCRNYFGELICVDVSK